MPTCEDCGKSYKQSHKRCADRDVRLKREAKEYHKQWEAEKIQAKKDRKEGLASFPDLQRCIIVQMEESIYALQQAVNSLHHSIPYNGWHSKEGDLVSETREYAYPED